MRDVNRSSGVVSTRPQVHGSHAHAFALFAMFYNFCRIHQTLRVTPAMEAGLTDHGWELEEVVRLAD